MEQVLKTCGRKASEVRILYPPPSMKSFSLFWILIILISFIIGFIAGNNHKTVDTSYHYQDLQNHSSTEEFPSPFDKSKKIIVTEKDTRENLITIQTNDQKIEVMRAVSPFGFQWTTDSKYVAFTDHVVSNQNVVYIIDIATGKYVQAEGETQFIESQSNPKDYTHVYTGNVGWYGNNQLIVVVNGHRDSDSFNPNPQYFLIDATNGKIIRRII